MELIKDLTDRHKKIDEEIRKPLREALLDVSILETQFRFDDAGLGKLESDR